MPELFSRLSIFWHFSLVGLIRFPTEHTSGLLCTGWSLAAWIQVVLVEDLQVCGSILLVFSSVAFLDWVPRSRDLLVPKTKFLFCWDCSCPADRSGPRNGEIEALFSASPFHPFPTPVHLHGDWHLLFLSLRLKIRWEWGLFSTVPCCCCSGVGFYSLQSLFPFDHLLSY